MLSGEQEQAQLINIATDGETYGHHHHFGDMALAYCLHYIESTDVAKLTVYGEYLEKYPPEYEIEIVENSSWSCYHGVERWRSNCGCNLGWGSQEWRTPLREAMDLLLIFLFLLSLAMISKGSDWFIESAVAISNKSGIPKMII